MSLKDIPAVEVKTMTECPECKVQSYSGLTHGSACSKYNPPGSIAWLDAQERIKSMPWNPDQAEGKEVCKHNVQKGYPCTQCNAESAAQQPDAMITISAKKLEAMQAELEAVHSDLGDPSQLVMDLLEELKSERTKVERLDTTVNALKAAMGRLKSQLADALKVI